jgi:L-alanine-DL-glutamate epimerase-like enolase superfamily enzyme
MIEGQATHERWAMAEPFIIAGHRYDHADVVLVELRADGAVGRGEGSPTSYYGETVESVLAQAREMVALLGETPWADLHDRLPPGAARNAVDCAVWDLRAKQANSPVWRLAGLAEPVAVRTAMTIGIDTPQDMARRAVASGHDVIKLKLGEGDEIACVAAVRAALPEVKLIVDANQAWDGATLVALMPDLARLGVSMIEQPLPADADAALAGMDRAVPVCADESCHVSSDLDRLVGRYDMVNIKLDKTGGLTEALRLVSRARASGFGIMVGCMEATSLAMAPALLIAGQAEVVDLDGPLLIGSDRPHGLRYAGGWVEPPVSALWG